MLCRWLGIPVCLYALGAGSLSAQTGGSVVVHEPETAQVRVEIREGRPLVNGVFVNGHGPYRFLLDTGSNVNLIEKRLGETIGMTAAFQAKVGSAVGSRSLPVSEGNEIA